MSDHFAEFFPLISIPQLKAYDITINKIGGEHNTVGGKLSYALQTEFKGHWVYSQNHLITDKLNISLNKIQDTINRLRSEQPDSYRSVETIKETDLIVDAQSQADFMVRLLSKNLLSKAENSLETIKLTNVYIQRELEIRGWSIDNKPTLSISVSSTLIYEQDLNQFVKKVKDLKKVVGLKTRTKHKNPFKGTIIDIDGTIVEKRDILLSLAKTEESKNYLKNAPDDEMVFWVEASSGTRYRYVSSQLNVIVEPAFYKLLGINGREVRKNTTLSPQIRSSLVGEASKIFKNAGYITDAYATNRNPNSFVSGKDFNFSSKVRIGSNEVVELDSYSIVTNLEKHGLFQLPTKTQDIKIGVLIGIQNVPPNNFWTLLKEQLEKFDISIGGSVPTETVKKLQPAELQRAINKLIEQKVDFVLALLPKANLNQKFDDASTWSPYIEMKRILIGQNIPNQVIEEPTLKKGNAIGNVALGIVSKLGSIPYELATPIDYADVIVGLDIAREKKKTLKGSKSAAASLQVYQSNGQFLGYRIPEAQLDGETIPPDIIRFLFPMDTFSEKRVIVHRDGYFRGNEKEALLKWAKEIGARFYLIEILKKTPPRMYKVNKKKIQKPEKGMAFIINDMEAILISSPPPFGSATPRPIRIKVYPPFNLPNALHSVLSLTLMHHGSLLQPRLPVTIHHSDKIASLALKNIRPEQPSGTEQFWL